MMMPKMTMKTIMTMSKCKQCALYLEAQGLFGLAMTSRSEAVIILMIIIIILMITTIILTITIIIRVITTIILMITIIMITIIMRMITIMIMIIIIGKREMGLTEVGEYPFSWWLCPGPQCTAQKRD